MIYVIDCVIFFLLFIVCFFIVIEMKKNRIMDSVQENLQKKMKGRRLEQEEKHLEDGYGQKESLFYRMDLALYQSGLQKKCRFLSSEVFLILSGMLTVGCFTAVLVLADSMLWAAAASAGVVFCLYAAIELLLLRNTERIEEDIMSFANLLDNYSKSTDDIVDIMDYTRAYLREPLRGAVSAFCSECRSGGDIRMAFRHLELAIRHRIFSELIRNIEICSRYNADYSAVVRKNRAIIESYLSAKEARKQLANTSRLQILIIYASAALSLWIMQGIGGGDIMALLAGTAAGNIILLVCIVIFLYSARLMFIIGRK